MMPRPGEPRSGLLVCTQAMTFDWPQPGQTVYLHPGAILRAGHPWTRGREQFFRPLVLVLDGERDAGGSVTVPVAVEALDPDEPLTGWTWAKVRVNAPDAVAATVFNVGG